LDLEQIKSDKILDTRGLTSPMPTLKAEKALNSLMTGKIMEIWCSDPESKKAIPDLVNQTGHQYMGYLDDHAGYIRLFIKKL